MKLGTEVADENAAGSANFIILDLDGNVIIIDQHV